MSRRTPLLALLSGAIAVTLPAAAGQAAPTPTCFGQPATIVGTAGPDQLIGQSGVADVIYAGPGDDYVSGGDFYEEDEIPGTAPDLICGGPGDDILIGGPGDDQIAGEQGNDSVAGGRGSDLMLGGVGRDRVIDESFEDMDSRDDVLRGGPGNDYITTGWGVDQAYGEQGNDVLFDLECSMTYMYGGPGNDTFESYWSSYLGAFCVGATDVLDGGQGNDRATTLETVSTPGVEYVEIVVPVP